MPAAQLVQAAGPSVARASCADAASFPKVTSNSLILCFLFLVGVLLFCNFPKNSLTLTSTDILFSPYTDSPGTRFSVTNASSFPLQMKTPKYGIQKIHSYSSHRYLNVPGLGL